MKMNDLLLETDFKIFKKNRESLSPEEREEVIRKKAVWHHGPNGEESCAIWKSKDGSGKTWYLSNTHRAWRKSPTLKGAIKEFEFVKSTS